MKAVAIHLSAIAFSFSIGLYISALFVDIFDFTCYNTTYINEGGASNQSKSRIGLTIPNGRWLTKLSSTNKSQA